MSVGAWIAIGVGVLVVAVVVLAICCYPSDNSF